MNTNPNKIERTILNAACRMLYRRGFKPTAGQCNTDFIASKIDKIDESDLTVTEIELLAHLGEDLRTAGHYAAPLGDLQRFVAEHINRMPPRYEQCFPRVPPLHQLDAASRHLDDELSELKRRGPGVILYDTPENVAAHQKKLTAAGVVGTALAVFLALL